MERRPLNTKIVYVAHLPEYCPGLFYLEVLHQNRSLLPDVEVLSERIQNMYNFQLLR